MQHTDFELASGSVIGRKHRTAYTNCQDGICVVSDRQCTISVVTDGCGSGKHSEIGAQLGARLLSQSLYYEAIRYPPQQINWARVRQDVLSRLHMLASGMGGSYRQVVQEYFLFTIVGVLLSSETATFFALGDGVLVINGDLYDLGVGQDNKPPYLGYALLEGNPGLTEVDTSLQVFGHWPLTELEHFLIGTDGVMDFVRAEGRNLPGLADRTVSDVSHFWADDGMFSNPDGISRLLRLTARDWPKAQPQAGLLPDDTTLVVGRRKPPIITEE